MNVWPFRYILLFDKIYYADNNAFFRQITNMYKDPVIKPHTKYILYKYISCYKYLPTQLFIFHVNNNM